ncbi:MAG: hypothetical protein DI556_06020 [Rhodovulum sulfidophilum]|uniref:Uncharacterized protein n=1 Tax=Rhodovulum sulfidophilum TaxID=35806 RepID=A0A2W5NC60_RHOSU|nr:MAG: hypothetical protein DI556_06020 [Rhodovulum sulfidophilum]
MAAVAPTGGPSRPAALRGGQADAEIIADGLAPMETRTVKSVLKAMPVKTDRRDAESIASVRVPSDAFRAGREAGRDPARHHPDGTAARSRRSPVKRRRTGPSRGSD